MKDWFLSWLIDVLSIFSIVGLGNLAIYLDGTITNIICSVLIWMIVYFLLQAHVYLSNKLNNCNNIFYLKH